MPFHSYIPAVPPCSGRALPGTKNLQAAILTRFTSGYNLGIYNCRPLTTNAKVPSIHSDGRAGDTGFPVHGGQPHADGYALVQLLRVNAWDLGIMGVIFDRRRWDWRTPWGRAYAGPNPHIDHVHWEQIPQAALTLTSERIAYLFELEDFVSRLTDEEIAWLKLMIAGAKEVGSNPDSLKTLILDYRERRAAAGG